jgi:hypothetical protein
MEVERAERAHRRRVARLPAGYAPEPGVLPPTGGAAAGDRLPAGPSRRNTVTPVDEAVAFRIDFPEFRETYGDRDQRILDDMMCGERTKELAEKHKLLPHVLFVQFLDGVPIEVQFLGHFLDGGRAATSAHEESEPLGIQWVVGEPVEPFAVHASTPRTQGPSEMENEVDALVATGEISSTS